MREPILPYDKFDKLNFLCLLATDLLGVTHLRDLPPLMMGFDSVAKTLPSPVQTAIQNLRLSGLAPWSQRELRVLVDAYNEGHEARDRKRRTKTRRLTWDDDAEPNEDALIGDWGAQTAEDEKSISKRFEIDGQLNVRRRWTSPVPEDIATALSSMTAPLPVRQRAPSRVHDPLKHARIARVTERNERFETRIDPLGFRPPEAPQMDMLRQGMAPGHVKWSDLIDVANRFDHLDQEQGRQPPGKRSWFHRLHATDGSPSAVLMGATPEGLQEIDAMDLSGVKHLIGLPGAGKTTLLYLLAAWAHERELKVCFLFPSIEVATSFIERLALYGVQSGLLYGQSKLARSKHVSNFASAIARDNRGYAVTRSASPFFATNCSLASFAGDEDTEFPHSLPPCQQVLQSPKPGAAPKPHHCALASVCGRQHAERSLVDATIWAGHILSTDRELSPHFSETRIRHFEYLARTFDLIVVDECDGAQANMDGRGTPLMKLTGDANSLWNRLLIDVHARAARGDNAFVAAGSNSTIMEMSVRFGTMAERLIASIVSAPTDFRDDYARKLLTGLSLISDLFHIQLADADSDELDERAIARLNSRKAFERIWDHTAKRIAFRYAREAQRESLQLELENEEAYGEGESSDPPQETNPNLLGQAETEKLAELAKVPPERITQFASHLFDALDKWERDSDGSHLRELANVMMQVPGLEMSAEPRYFVNHVGLLSMVTLLVLQHFGLAPHLRMLNAQGILGDEIFQSRPSREMLGLIPESLAGRLSGVRYSVNDDGDVDVSHIGFSGTPRLLINRMAKLGSEAGLTGPAVLLTSATSLLKDSPSFNIKAGPHYVLKRPNAGDGWLNSRYFFCPVKDPHDDSKRLYFSGARMNRREFVLKGMVSALLDGDRVSKVEVAIAQNDVVNEVRRKAAFVVNSYEQCQMVHDHIHQHFPTWRSRVRYLVRGGPMASATPYGITASEVERLGETDDWDLLIFPMSAIGRGVNIVYKLGPRVNQAMIGSLFFLTRPHPRADSLSFLQGVVASASEHFDQDQFSSTEEALAAMREQRASISRTVGELLRLPQASRALGAYATPFVADQMIMILQTIGRAMRGDCPAFVYFVDAAWAPKSAQGMPDTARTSMLLMMLQILDTRLIDPDASLRQCYENLYRTFYMPLSRVTGLISIGQERE